jgi:hypothetical protein
VATTTSTFLIIRHFLFPMMLLDHATGRAVQ